MADHSTKETSRATPSGDDNQSLPEESPTPPEVMVSAKARFWDRYGDLFTTALLALASVLTAWAGFQSAKWSGVQAINFNQAGANRTESARSSAIASQASAIDVQTYIAWLDASATLAEDPRYAESDTNTEVGIELLTEITEGDSLAGFLFQRLRAEFKPAVLAWLETNPFGSDSAPPSPFEMPEYVLADAARADELRIVAEERAAEALENNQQSDDYVLLTVLFATVVFFAGLSMKMNTERSQVAVFTLGCLIFAVSIAGLIRQPIEFGDPSLFG